jgi:hypothetical protein
MGSSLPTSLQGYDLSSGGVPSTTQILGSLPQQVYSSQRSSARSPGRSLHASFEGVSPHGPPRPVEPNDAPAPALLARPGSIEKSPQRTAQRAGARSHIQAPMQAEDPLDNVSRPEYLFTTGLFVARKPPYTVSILYGLFTERTASLRIQRTEEAIWSIWCCAIS